MTHEEEIDAHEDAYFALVGKEYEKLEEAYSRTGVKRRHELEEPFESAAADLAHSLWEHKKLQDDKNLRRYHDPSEEELEAIIAFDEGYRGDWYHSEVHISAPARHATMRENFADPQWRPQQLRLHELDNSSSGIYRLYAYPASDEDTFVQDVLGKLDK